MLPAVPDNKVTFAEALVTPRAGFIFRHASRDESETRDGPWNSHGVKTLLKS